MKTRFDIIAETYEKAISSYPLSRTDELWLIAKLSLKPDDKVLEITAGTGYLTEKILPLIKDGQLISQDISPEMLAFNRSKCKEFNNVEFYLESDMTFPRLKGNYFDKAVCLGGFHHIDEQVRVVKTVFEKLKKGGVFCVGDFADASAVQRYFDERVNDITPTGHIGFFLSTSQMVNMGRAAGFSSCEVVRKKVSFHFAGTMDIGVFYQLVHGLSQNPSETVKDISRYMGIKKDFSVPMDYVYVKYIK